MPRITDIYRPVIKAEWLDALDEYAQTELPNGAVRICQPEDCLLRLADPSDLAVAFATKRQSLDDAITLVKTALSSHGDDNIVRTNGVSYKKRYSDEHPTELFVKVHKDLVVTTEQALVYNALKDYGLNPNGEMKFFNITIGSVLLSNFAGKQKQDLCSDIADFVPERIDLGPSVIKSV